jgi:hypothetical protein
VNGRAGRIQAALVRDTAASSSPNPQLDWRNHWSSSPGISARLM